MSEVADKKQPLEDLMVAMDVVDTLRHQQGIAERELDGEGRRGRLLLRLRDLYKAQGIDVPDHVLQEGIDALEQERFLYEPVKPSFGTKMARLWVSRGRWGKPVGFLAVLGSLFSGVYLVTDVLPEQQMRSSLPKQLEASLSTIRIISKDPAIVSEAEGRVVAAKQAINNQQYEQANKVLDGLKTVSELLQTEYSVRVISRPGESSGVWRIPDVNQSGRNYYLIVEAIGKNNKIVSLDILSEESNTRKKVKTWGLRVNEQTFYQISADKKDDGIIQGNQVGKKDIGYLEPQFSIATTGSTITEW